MAYYKSSSLLFILAALVIGNAQLGHGQISAGIINSTQINVNGNLFCTPNGNFQLGALGVGGVAVSATLSLNGTRVFTAVNITGPEGQIQLSANLNNLVGGVLSVIGGQLPIPITVALPVNGTNCTALPRNGRIVSIPSLQSVNITPFSVALNFTAGSFIVVG